MKHELNDITALVTLPARRSSARLAASLALLLCAFILFQDMVAATERPPSSRYPAVVIYVGSG